jgi:RNA polymerase sigma-70 factor, ECF subfamily
MDKLIQCETPLYTGCFEGIDLSETEAIRLAQEGVLEGFERLYNLHSRRVYTLCLRMMRGNTSEAEDLTQETFLHLFRKIGTFRGEAAFSTWLHRVAFNIALMRLRKTKKIAPQLSLEETKGAEDETSRFSKVLGAPDLRISGLIDRVNLQRAVQELPSGYKSVFVLHDVLGYEHNEIARALGCSVGNSKSQLHKARALLRQLLQNGKRIRTSHRRTRRAERSQRICELSFADQLVPTR